MSSDAEAQDKLFALAEAHSEDLKAFLETQVQQHRPSHGLFIPGNQGPSGEHIMQMAAMWSTLQLLRLAYARPEWLAGVIQETEPLWECGEHHWTECPAVTRLVECYPVAIVTEPESIQKERESFS